MSSNVDWKNNHKGHFCTCIVDNQQLFIQVGCIVDNWQPFTQVGRIVDNWQSFTQVVIVSVLLITDNLLLKLVVLLITGNYPSVRAISSRGLEGGGGGAHMAKLGMVELG